METTQVNQSSTPNAMSAGQIKTNRSLLKLILLSIVTFGIYAIIFYCGVTSDINTIASKYDGKKTMNWALLVLLITPITFGIAYFVWYHNISNRIGNELKRRGIDYSFSANTFWGWNVLGSIIAIGPFVYLYKFINAMNKLAEHYNVNG